MTFNLYELETNAYDLILTSHESVDLDVQGICLVFQGYSQEEDHPVEMVLEGICVEWPNEDEMIFVLAD
jgi:hypothetical protein